jgi:hypothetical protein
MDDLRPCRAIVGAIVYGIYPTASAAEVDYQMRDGGTCVFIAEDQEYVDGFCLSLISCPTYARS